MQDDGWTDDEPNWREAAWYELAHAACYALLFVGGLLLMPGVVGGI